MPFALDNGLYHPPNVEPKGMKALPPFYRMLQSVKDKYRPIWVVAPDVPYDGAASLPLSVKHRRHIAEIWPDVPVAIAVQDGMAWNALDAADWAAVFVAGSTEWKWQTFARWTEEAHRRGMLAHVARVNTAGRVRQCVDNGVDSVDGTGIFRGDKKQLAGVLGALLEVGLYGQRA